MSGLVYQGIPVNADGSRYTGTPEEANPDIAYSADGTPYIWQDGKLVVAPGFTGGGAYAGAASTGVKTVGGSSTATSAASVAVASMNAAADMAIAAQRSGDIQLEIASREKLNEAQLAYQ